MQIGELYIFKDEEFFQKWLIAIDGDVMDFIILEISKFNKIIEDNDIENSNKEVKKK